MAATYTVNANGHAGKFHVGAAQGAQEQLVFVGSHSGVSWTPEGRDRVLAYVTVTNDGPRAIQVFWDGPPPGYKTPPSPVKPTPSAPTDQFTTILASNSTTMVVGRAVKVVYAPQIDPADTGTAASGDIVVSWCCPPVWDAPASVPTKAPVPVPAPIKDAPPVG